MCDKTEIRIGPQGFLYRRTTISIYELQKCKPYVLQSWSWKKFKTIKYIVHVQENKVEIRQVD